MVHRARGVALAAASMPITDERADMRESNRPRFGAPVERFRSNCRASTNASIANNYQGMEMTDVIELLERIGQDPQLREASRDGLERAVAAADLAPDLREAILSGDQAGLEALLQRLPTSGYLFPGKEDEEQSEEGDDEEVPLEEPADAPERVER